MKTSLRTTLGTGAVVAALLATAACSSTASGETTVDQADAATVSITHAQGTTDVPVNPEKVYTFDLGVLDSLTSLGVDVTGVPEAVYPASLTQYSGEEYTKIGSMKEPDFEAIAAGDPDLIIISARASEAYGELSEIAPTIDLTVDAADPLPSFKEHTETLGKIFDKEEEVTAKLTGIDEQIAAVAAEAPNAGSALILMTSATEVTAYGAGSRFGLIHDVLGFPTAADVKSEGPHGEAVSFEFIKEANPANIFAIDRDAAFGESTDASAAVLDNELVDSTDAAKNDKIISLDAGSWYLVGYGLNNLPTMIDQVASAL
ncbi:siderophore ABC transporter substrate-binding protein [Jonesia quinghaiensis]|uniref:siderophore ABC transporter substrate-binding protein n=1 Tax=Jonesia quinghaiensis TaxID=262806 RepID=UPI000400BA0F|nr:siderophore ABC transporter substrate-binding protein [Jonesia quinghaiensis]